MKLNDTAYVHKQIRLLCRQLELLTNMKLVTDLGEEFDQIKFIGKLGYIIIDYKKEACFTLSYSMDKKEWSTVRDIMLYLEWLDIGNNYIEERQKRSYDEKKSSKLN